MVASTHACHQAPLIHFVESDDLFLHDQVDVVWFDVLNTLDYHAFQATAAHYYEQLFTFNQQQKQRRIERRETRLRPIPRRKVKPRNARSWNVPRSMSKPRHSTSGRSQQLRLSISLRTKSFLASLRCGWLADRPSVSSPCSMASSARPSPDNQPNRNSSTSGSAKTRLSLAPVVSP